MKRKDLRAFITEHRTELDAAIIRHLTRYDKPGFKRDIHIDDAERRLWILNDEGLYNWARSEGVMI